MKIEKASIKDLNEIVYLHEKGFEGVLSGQLGEKFLFDFYKELFENKNCAIFVAKSNNEVIGFIAGSADGNYLNLTTKYKLITTLLNKCVTNPKNILEFLRITKRKFYYIILKIRAELVAIVVKIEYRRKGVGKELVKKLEDFFIKNKVSSYHVFTDGKVSKGSDFYYFLKFRKAAFIELFGYSGIFLQKFLR